MGACVSSHHKSSVSNRKHANHTVIVPSPVKEKLPIINGHVAVKPQLPPLHSTTNSRDYGSKEETFFDSQAWLESDCESDFMSVNGEFTPSRGNTPVHHNLSATTMSMNGGALAFDDHKLSMGVSQLSASPVKKSKRLSELFSESQREDRNCDESANEVVAVDGGVFKPKRERWVESVRVHGCLPRVLSSCRPITHLGNGNPGICPSLSIKA
ncbi:hypothetical protein QVD17_36574 [Tagetes erecta]|uniref:Uncharacterized protein n=1 Tax=Tagetes erecta TaxID=13708 RepID=A0AAD8NJ40_TARER|nr:hypothetical protein QVD17_36574 [Tagetes erecta]